MDLMKSLPDKSIELCIVDPPYGGEQHFNFRYGTGDQVDLRYLSSEMELKVGDRLVTSGIDGIYLPGIPVAQITQAQKIVASPFYRVKCIALAGLKQARYVTILPKNALPANLARAQEETITPASEVQGNTQRSRP